MKKAPKWYLVSSVVYGFLPILGALFLGLIALIIYLFPSLEGLEEIVHLLFLFTPIIILWLILHFFMLAWFMVKRYPRIDAYIPLAFILAALIGIPSTLLLGPEYISYIFEIFRLIIMFILNVVAVILAIVLLRR